MEVLLGPAGHLFIIQSEIYLLNIIKINFVVFFPIQTASKDYWCARPDHLSQLSIPEWRNLSQTPNGCNILDLDYGKVTYENEQLINWPANASDFGYRKCQHFEFSDEDGTAKTLVQEFELVCGRNILSLVETCFLVGAAAGAVLSGWISDRFGRRHTLMAFVTIQSVFGEFLDMFICKMGQQHFIFHFEDQVLISQEIVFIQQNILIKI